MIKDNEKTNRSIEQAYNNRKYIVAGRNIYQPFYSVNAGYYAHKVYTERGNLPLTKTNRYFHCSAKHCNELVGFELLREL